jgi:4,5-dihydroxyphthalate decarboxylase
MHLIVLRADVYRRAPWVAMELTKAFTRAKDRSLRRLLDPTAPHFPIPWGTHMARAVEEVFGRDFWPYGVEPNRVTLEAFLRYAGEQGLLKTPIEVADLFPESVRESYRV